MHTILTFIVGALFFVQGASLCAEEPKVLVMTHCFNKPEFIIWQYETFKRFLKDDYEFVVFNDAKNRQYSEQVQDICHHLQIRCIKVPQSVHRPPYYLPRDPSRGGASAECAETIQYMYDTIATQHPGIAVIIDSDMFLIREFSFEKLINGFDIGAHPQYRIGKNRGMIVKHFLPNLLIFNMPQLPGKYELDFNLGEIDGTMVDTGGCTHYYIQNYPQLKWLETAGTTETLNENNTQLTSEEINQLKACKRLFALMTKMEFDYEFYVNYTFLHFRAGSNWNMIDPKKMHAKTKLFVDMFEELLQN